MRPASISKLLSSNDTGETGGHQAGMLIPKGGDILEFFPSLDPTAKNPRAILVFEDEASQHWKFNFIYYNNRFFGGTRNEYRLTGMTSFIHQHNLKAGDTVILSRRPDGCLSIRCQRQGRTADGKPKLVVTGTWKVVKY